MDNNQLIERKRPSYRALNGVFLLDKPLGLSSNQALQKSRKLFMAKKAGHTGSLDPLATGLLVICFGEGTKFSRYLLDADKRYTVTAQLGVRTDTSDAEGEIIQQRSTEHLTPQIFEEAIQKFRGTTQQVPSMFSALKHKGVPLYKLARQGIEVERPSRDITIYHLEVISFSQESFTLDVSCSKGTYIRTLVDDIGEALGCGAHVTALHRTEVGPFSENMMTSLEDLQSLSNREQYEARDALLLPIQSMLDSMPLVSVSGSSAFYLKNGHPVMIPKAPQNRWVQIKDDTQDFLGVGEILDDGRLAPRRLLSVKS